MTQAFRRALSAALPGLAALGCAQAAEVERPLWEFGMGAAALRLPHYRGSEQSRNWLLPLPFFIYRGDIFKADREGARAVLFDAEHAELDVSLSASPPTRSRDDRAREGMADLKPTFELGPNLKLGLARGSDWKLELRAPLRAVLTIESRPNFVGWSATPHLNLDLRPGSGWNLGLQAGPVFGSRRLHAYYYDVPAADARAGRSPFHAAGGAAGGRLLASASRRFGAHWVAAFVSVDSLSGARFEDSPLVTRRSNASFGLAWSWVLATSTARVVVDE